MLKSALQLSLLFILLSCKNENTLFRELGSSETNIEFANSLTESEDFNVLRYGYFYNGGGVAAADFNNDGWLDLYFTGNLKPNKLYLNEGKGLTYKDITEQAGVAAEKGWNTGVSVVDINADGWLDIYISRSAAQDPFLRKNLLFINNGIKKGENHITFTEKAAEYGLANKGYTSQTVFFDYDKDGDLDAYILNHSVQGYAGFSKLLSANKKVADPELGSKLMQNENGFFKDITQEAGIIANVLGFGLGISIADFNNDGWPDMYVSNDYNEEDYLYINNQNGSFREVVKEQTGHISLFSMGNDAADINNDGNIDMVSLDMLPESNERIKMTSGDDNYDKYQMLINSGFHHQSMRNMLQLNNGNGTFSEIGQLAGISNTDWSWSALCADYDLDGNKDLFITNGYAKDYTNMDFLKYSMNLQIESQELGKPINQLEVIQKIPSITEANYIYRNNGNLQFENKQNEWGLAKPMMSNGAIYADLDNDGDLDLVVNNINEEAKVFENTQTAQPNTTYLKIQLNAPNPSLLIGARVSVYAKGKQQVQEFYPTRGYASSTFAPLVFGLAKATADSVVVCWTDGSTENIKKPQQNKLLTINYKKTEESNKWLNKQNIGKISSVTIEKPENPHNDFKIQPLLPKMQSVYGSRMALGNLTPENQQAIFVCGNPLNSSQLLVHKNGNIQNQPIKIPQNVFDKDAAFGDLDADGDLDLVVVSGNYAATRTTGNELKPRIYFDKGNGKFDEPILLNFPLNASSVAILDFDRDGKNDIFIGGATVPQNYPNTEPSLLLLNRGKGIFEKKELAVLKNIGIVRDIQAIDLDKDGRTDIVTAGEFQPIRLLKNNGKDFVINEIGPSGLWNRIKAIDVDGDGTIEIVAGNEGLNSQLVKLTDANGLKLLAGRYGVGNQSIPLIAYSQNNTWYPFASRDEILDQIPTLKSRYTDYSAYSKATLADVAETRKTQIDWQAKEFKTLILKQINGKYKPQYLPIEAQFSPVYAIEVMDFNHDGFTDIILAGNESKTRVRLGKIDASYVQVFLGNKNKTFTYLPNAQSGISVKGDASDIKVIGNKVFVLKH